VILLEEQEKYRMGKWKVNGKLGTQTEDEG
jgi:hypothetical protein